MEEEVSKARALTALGLRDEDLLGAFVWGSRAFGTSTTSSGTAEERQEHGGWRDPDERRCWAAFFRGDDLDATVYERGYWQEMLDYHDIHIMLCQFSLPSHLVIKRSDESFLIPEVVELMKLKFSVYIYTMGPLEQAHKKYRQRDYRGAKKSFVHCLRYLMMAIEVVQTRKPFIKDHTIGNCYHEEVFARFPEGDSFTWDELLGWYTPLADRFMSEFKDLANAYKLATDRLPVFDPDLWRDRSPSVAGDGQLPYAAQFATTAYMRRRRCREDAMIDVLRRLREELSVTAHNNRFDPALIHFNHCAVSSPPQCSVVTECCRLVLQWEGPTSSSLELAFNADAEAENDRWRVACLPYLKMWSFSGLEIDLETLATHKMDWLGQCRLWEKPVGISAYLFYHSPSGDHQGSDNANRWLLSFSSNNFYAGSVRRRMERVIKDEHRRMSEQEWDATLEDWFWTAWRARGLSLPATSQGRQRCYMFRFIPPSTVMHTAGKEDGDGDAQEWEQGRVVLTGVRNQSTLCEEDPAIAAAEHGWECAREHSELLAQVMLRCGVKESAATVWSPQYQRKVLTELRAEASKLSVVDAEGFVLCDARYSRIGLPSLQFAGLSGLSPFLYRFVKQPLMLAVVRASLHEEQRFTQHYPEWREWFAYVADKLRGFARTIGTYYATQMRQLSDRELAQRLKQLSKPLQAQRKHLWKQRKRNQQQQSASSADAAEEEKEATIDNALVSVTSTRQATPAQERTDDDSPIRQFGDLSRLFWAIRRREQGEGSDTTVATTPNAQVEDATRLVLACLVSWKDRTDGPFTHKLEEWLWKSDNAMASDKDKLVRMRHATHRPTTLLRREGP